MARYTTLRQQAKDLAGKSFQGKGSARHLVPGTWFELADHPIHDQDNPEDRQFLVTGLTFDAQNNQTPEAKQSLGGLLSKTAATSMTGQAAGNQLDRDMLLGQMQTAEGIANSLSDLSDQHGADKTETEAQSQLLKHVENWEKGSNTTGKENSTEGGKPVVALSGPLGIAAGTPESMTLTAGHNLDLVSVKHTNHSVGGKWLARVSESFSLFVHKLGMKLIAAGGHIDIQAQDGELRISANKKITITSSEEILLQAPKVTTIAQGAKIEMGGGEITTQCSGKHEQKAALHEINGPGGGTPIGAFNPQKADFDQKAVLNWMGTGEPIQNRRYRIKLEDGRVLEGMADADGRTELLMRQIGSRQACLV